METQRLFQTAIILMIFLLSESCATNPVTGKKELMLLSKSQEIAMGKQSDPEIVNFFGLYDDPEMQKMIQERGQEMVEVSHRDKLSYEFKIVDSPVINAFAVPGGYVYFTRGIMAHFNNEAEFAGVLGHEIGHITARHSAKQYSNSMLAQVGLAAGMVISPEFAQFADIAQQGISLLFLQFSRNHERQSDKLGVEYATKIGYDAAEMAGFFQTLDNIRQQGGGEATPTFLSTHPDPQDREQRVQRLAEKWKSKLEGTDYKVERDSYLKMIDGMVYGKDPKQGFVENGTFFHPVLKFKFPIPNQWTIQNTPQQVQLAERNGNALMLLRLAQSASLEETAKEVLAQNQLELAESKELTVNGLPAIAMVADQNQEGGSIRTLTYLIQYDGNIYYLMGISRAEDFSRYSDTFMSSMRNFSELRDPEMLDMKAERIIIREVPASGTLSSVFSKLNVERERFEEMAILNGINLNDRVEQGMLIKTVGK
ncbi:putative Zn-dependent protease [Catalinimonas alkaloidigena]|uniref:M48 family metalloprotease n=1 Tax=Catalinimonas alkaloidigena TaxID=1075417 RepID=UPI0024054C74|nr:M48 family metalloprotease [Catalinimonas alkaloidigena]MDF9797259.1 putative Zn-dependent protease [Catalinimonas alkaloidigena]